MGLISPPSPDSSVPEWRLQETELIAREYLDTCFTVELGWGPGSWLHLPQRVLGLCWYVGSEPADGSTHALFLSLF